MSQALILLAGAAAAFFGWWLGRRQAGPEAAQADALRGELDASRREADALRERAARAEAQAEEARRQLAEDQARLDKLKAEISVEAARILEESRGRLREEAGQQFDKVLGPLKQNLEDLKRLHESGAQGQASLQTAVRALADAHNTFSQKANELSLSLKGNVKGQGRWGEFILERVLEAAGLRAGQEYVLQGKGLELRSSDGDSQKPDAIVMLPDGKHLVVDAKTSLDGYDSWVKADDEAARDQAAQLQALAIRKQVKDLSEKQYDKNERLNSPEFSIMFVPSEPALGLALQKDPTLFDQAWEKRIVVVGPNTLFGTLKVVSQLWGQERRNKYADEIAKRGGLLFDKLVGFVEDLGKAKAAMRTAMEFQDAAHQKLVEGRGNVIGQAKELKALGAKVTKSLPANWTEAADEP